MWGDIAIAFLLAFITAYVVTPYTIRLAKRIGALDNPKDNRRKIHRKPMPRLGGLAIIAGFLVSAIYLIIVICIEGTLNIFGEEQYWKKILGMLLASIVLGIFCFMDDKRGIKPYTKLLGQILAATIVLLSGIRIDTIVLASFNTVINEEILLNIITIIWIVVITNAINLIDGLDGLSAGISAISCLSLIIIFSLNGSPLISILLVTALAGGIIGFLPYNMNPAKTFVGDTGSNFMGFALSIISILGVAKTYTAIVLIAPLIIFAVPLIDTGFAITRRIIKTKSLKGVFRADAEHVHHKLMKKGYTQRQAVFMLYGISASFGMFAIILLESGFWKAISFLLMVIAIVAVGYKDIIREKGQDKENEQN